MKIRYINTRGDLAWMQWHCIRYQRVLMILMAGAFIYLTYDFATHPSIEEAPLWFKIIYGLLHALIILAVGLLAGTAMGIAKMFSGKHVGLLGEHELQATDEGLIEKTEFNQTLSKWNAFVRVRDTGTHYYLFISDWQAHIIPKKRPLLEGDIASFINECHLQMRQFPEVATSAKPKPQLPI